MTVTDPRYWWQNNYVGYVFRYVGDAFEMYWIGHQHLKLVTNTIHHWIKSYVGDKFIGMSVQRYTVYDQVYDTQCWRPILYIEKITNITKNVGSILILPPTSEISHQHHRQWLHQCSRRMLETKWENELVTSLRCWWPILYMEKITNITKNVGSILILPPTSEISHQHHQQWLHQCSGRMLETKWENELVTSLRCWWPI